MALISWLNLEKQALYMELVPDVELCDGVYEVINTFNGKAAVTVVLSSHRKEIHAILNAHDLRRVKHSDEA